MSMHTFTLRFLRPEAFPVTVADHLLDESSCEGIEQYYDSPEEAE